MACPGTRRQGTKGTCFCTLLLLSLHYIEGSASPPGHLKFLRKSRQYQVWAEEPLWNIREEEDLYSEGIPTP